MKNESNNVYKKNVISRSVFSKRNYLFFFLSIWVIVTTSLILFTLSTDIDFSSSQIGSLYILLYILGLSVICTFAAGIYNKITIERPVKQIIASMKLLMNGDLTVRITPIHKNKYSNEFDLIIEYFNKMAQQLSSIETLHNDFISTVSHEFKTPISIIQNYSTLLQGNGLSKEELMEYSKAITSSTRSLSELISNTLKLNKLENQQIFPKFEKYELSEQIRKCLINFEDVWENKELIIQVDMSECSIFADEELLALVWNNLFSNAIKFTDKGGRISVTLSETKTHTVVTVMDTGCGMDSTTQAHIFDKFYQGDSSRSIQGNGLGLSLVKRIVDIVDGEISVASEIGTGSTFTLKFKKTI